MFTKIIQFITHQIIFLMSIDETWDRREKYRKIKVVYLQNDSYLSFHLPYRSKHSTI